MNMFISKEFLDKLYNIIKYFNNNDELHTYIDSKYISVQINI